MSQNENVYKEIHILSLLSLWKSNPKLRHGHAQKMLARQRKPRFSDATRFLIQRLLFIYWLYVQLSFPADEYNWRRSCPRRGREATKYLPDRPLWSSQEYLPDQRRFVSQVTQRLLCYYCDSSAYCHEERELESSTGAYDMGTSLSTTAVYLWLRQR